MKLLVDLTVVMNRRLICRLIGHRPLSPGARFGVPAAAAASSIEGATRDERCCPCPARLRHQRLPVRFSFAPRASGSPFVSLLDLLSAARFSSESRKLPRRGSAGGPHARSLQGSALHRPPRGKANGLSSLAALASTP